MNKGYKKKWLWILQEFLYTYFFIAGVGTAVCGICKVNPDIMFAVMFSGVGSYIIGSVIESKNTR